MRRPKPPFFLIPNLLVVVLVTVMATLSPAIPCSWAQTTAHSPESFLDCKQIDFGSNIFDRNMNCCLPGEQTCQKCFYTKSKCENVFGCDTTATQDVNGTCCFDGQKTCNECFYQKTVCETKLNTCNKTLVEDSTPRRTCCQPSAIECGECNHRWDCPKHFGCGVKNEGCGCGQPKDAGCGCGNRSKDAFWATITCPVKDTYKMCIGAVDQGEQDPGLANVHYLVNQGTSTHTGWKGNFGNVNGVNYCWSNHFHRFCGCVRGDSKGCFDPDTEVLLEEGRLVKVKDLRPGDRVYNPLTRSSSTVRDTITGPEPIPMFEFGFDGFIVKVTSSHPILTKGGMKRARDVRVGDVVFDAFGNEQTITYAREAELLPTQKVVNLALDSDSPNYMDHLVVANNIITGDLTIQNSKLEGE